MGRNNWLFIGGDRGLSTAAVLMSVCASTTRHGVNQWEYFRDLFDRLPALTAKSDLTSLLPDHCAKAHAGHESRPTSPSGAPPDGFASIAITWNSPSAHSDGGSVEIRKEAAGRQQVPVLPSAPYRRG